MIAYDHELKKLHFIHYARLEGSETREEKQRIFKKGKEELKQLTHRLSGRKTTKELFLPQGRHTAPSFKGVQSTYEKSRFWPMSIA